jgi:hypothetical protein
LGAPLQHNLHLCLGPRVLPLHACPLHHVQTRAYSCTCMCASRWSVSPPTPQPWPCAHGRADRHHAGELQTQDEAGGVGRTGLDRPPVALQNLSEVHHHWDGCRQDEHTSVRYQLSLTAPHEHAQQLVGVGSMVSSSPRPMADSWTSPCSWRKRCTCTETSISFAPGGLQVIAQLAARACPHLCELHIEVQRFFAC